MSVSLAWQPAQNLLAAHANHGTPDLASEPFAVGPGALLILAILGSVLLVATGRVLSLVWQVIRHALPVLIVLLIGLGVVTMIGAASMTRMNPGGTPGRPGPATSPPAPRPTTGPPRRSGTPAPSSTSLAGLGGSRTTHR